MGKLSVLILLLVVMSNQALGNPVDNSSHLDGDYQTPRAAAVAASEQQQEILSLPSLNQLAHQASALGLINRNDDHSNIELDKLAAFRYDVLPASSPSESATSDLDAGNSNNLARLFSKIIVSDRPNPNGLARAQWERKRRDLPFREDKDYSFVMAPAAAASAARFNGQRDARLAAAQMLRDMLLSRAKALRFASGRNNLDQLSQATGGPTFNSISYNGQDSMPNYREKRRRCKVDPNLGVKNPSFCDTDAYFGAADYSMRDVWDSAGR